MVIATDISETTSAAAAAKATPVKSKRRRQPAAAQAPRARSNRRGQPAAAATPNEWVAVRGTAQSELELVYVTKKQLAHMLQIGPRTVTRMMINREIPFYKMHPSRRGSVRFKLHEVVAIMDKKLICPRS